MKERSLSQYFLKKGRFRPHPQGTWGQIRSHSQFCCQHLARRGQEAAEGPRVHWTIPHSEELDGAEVGSPNLPADKHSQEAVGSEAVLTEGLDFLRKMEEWSGTVEWGAAGSLGAVPAAPGNQLSSWGCGAGLASGVEICIPFDTLAEPHWVKLLRAGKTHSSPASSRAPGQPECWL